MNLYLLVLKWCDTGDRHPEPPSGHWSSYARNPTRGRTSEEGDRVRRERDPGGWSGELREVTSRRRGQKGRTGESEDDSGKHGVKLIIHQSNDRWVTGEREGK